jgi:methyl-accepting chemotaxis protein
MTGLSSLYKSGIICSIVSAVLIGSATAGWWIGLVDGPVAALHGVLGAALLAAFFFQWRVGEAMKKAISVCRDGARGRFESRITDIREGGEIGTLFNSINDLLDPIDAFVREATACLDSVSRNQFYRTVVETGMHGSFVHAARIINTATAGIETRVGEFHHATEAFGEATRSIADTVTGSAEQLKGRAVNLTETSDRTAQRLAELSASAANASENVETVSAVLTRLAGSSQGRSNRRQGRKPSSPACPTRRCASARSWT